MMHFLSSSERIRPIFFSLLIALIYISNNVLATGSVSGDEDQIATVEKENVDHKGSLHLQSTPALKHDEMREFVQSQWPSNLSKNNYMTAYKSLHTKMELFLEEHMDFVAQLEHGDNSNLLIEKHLDMEKAHWALMDHDNDHAKMGFQQKLTDIKKKMPCHNFVLECKHFMRNFFNEGQQNKP